MIQALHLIGYIFNYNFSWFIILEVLSITLLVIVFWKKRDMKLLVLYFFVGSLASHLENIIFVWFPSYEYYPHLLKNQYYDMTLGAYFSQQYNVTSAALFIAAFNLEYGWILCFAALFVSIELLFLKLGIYKLIWWNPFFTFIGLQIFFWVAKKWYRFLLEAVSPVVRFFTLFSIAYMVHVHLIIVPLLSDHFHFAINWFNSSERNTLTLVLIYCYISGLLTAIVVFYKLHRTLQAFAPILMGGGYSVLMYLQIFTFKYDWDLIILIGADIVPLICCIYFHRILSRTKLPS